jgi:hypothetical protein
VVVLVVVKILLCIKEVLSYGVQSDIVHSCTMEAHVVEQLCIFVFIVDMYLCCKQHLLCVFIYKYNLFLKNIIFYRKKNKKKFTILKFFGTFAIERRIVNSSPT